MTAPSHPTQKVDRAIEDLNAFLERRTLATAGAGRRTQPGMINTATAAADTYLILSMGPTGTHSLRPFATADAKYGGIPPFLRWEN